MRTRVLTLALGCCAWLSTVGVPVRAHAEAAEDVDAGRSHFKAGVDYYRDGDLSAAMIEFKRAYSVAPNYRILYNLGQVSRELRDYTEAERYFQRYLTEGGGEIDAPRKREVENELAKLAARIAVVVLSCNVEDCEFLIDDVSVGKSPMGEPVRVSAGTRRITAVSSNGGRVTKVVEAAGGDTLVVKLEITDMAVADSSAPATRRAPEQAVSSGPGAALWLGIGTGALAVATGVFAYLASDAASSYRDKLEQRLDSQKERKELDDLKSGAKTKALVTDILLGTTVVAAATTLIVALSSGGREERAPSESQPTAATQISLGAGSLHLSRQF